MSNALLCLNPVPADFKNSFKPFEGVNIEEIYWGGRLDAFMEETAATFFEEVAKNPNEIYAVEALQPNKGMPFRLEVNLALANALNAAVIANGGKLHKIRYAAKVFGDKFLGAVAYDNEAISVFKASGIKVFSPSDQAAIEKAALEFKPAGLSPALFRHKITSTAKAAQKRIVLPEGDEPRTVKAAAFVAKNQYAKCILLADEKAVAEVARNQGVSLEGLEIVNPEKIRSKYVARLVELRSAKGMTEEKAIEALQDNVMLGTMMLEAGEADGLVSGAVHTTANTMRPPLQIIKTAKGSKMVSSVFFMCLEDRVLAYADCAIVPKPTADELAEIAIQTNDSAKAFGLEPRVAMISYSTGTSGKGEDVEKVAAATEKVKELRPDILVDGPLQYDAAVMLDVARSKAPNSPVAGQANVFIFPDLNVGNALYKAVQRHSGAIAMGPVLQGMRMPVNDLSRGALVEDIIYTIAITAVQATQAN